MFERLDEKLKAALAAVQKPGRYTGGEPGCVYKEKEKLDLRFAFCFPDTYEVGMSFLGMKILYEILNKRDNIWCERVFMPWVDMKEQMQQRDIPLYALESKDPLGMFDVVGFTLQYELSYTNILAMLDLAHIPFYAKDRGEDAPFIVAGGPCVCNAEPLADFFDLMMLGEGEVQLPDVCDTIIQGRREGLTKREILKRLCHIEGVYVPAFYDVSYRPDGRVEAITAKEGAPAVVRKAIIQDMNSQPLPENFVVPMIGAVHDRAQIEVLRGCVRGCRFCQAGMIYRPLRERSLSMLEKLASTGIKGTGNDEISLSSLSSSDYSHLPELCNYLIDNYRAKNINIALPSLRIDAFSLDVMSKVQDVRKSSLTFAPEAGTQRMRDVINKGLTEEVILHGAMEAFKGGWSKVKLYFMMGLPTETEEDIKGIAHLAEKIAMNYYSMDAEYRHGRISVGASASFFVPKPFTPFQWASMCEEDEYKQKAHIVNDEFKIQHNHRSLSFKWHDAKTTVLEGILARGDRRICKVIYDVYKKGCIYDAWTEFFDYDTWMETMEENALDYHFYTTRKRELDEVFPWDFIDIGVTKEFLKREWNNAMAEKVTPNCREKCSGCGAARFGGGVCYESKSKMD